MSGESTKEKPAYRLLLSILIIANIFVRASTDRGSLFDVRVARGL